MSTNNNKYFGGGIQFEIIWNRIIKETDIDTLTKLGDLIGKRQQTVSAAKKNNLFPYGWAYPVANKYNLLTEWLITGEGPKRLSEITETKNYNFPILNDLNEWLEELTTKEPHRKDWFKGNLEDAFPMFKEWKKRKDEAQSQDYISQNSKIA